MALGCMDSEPPLQTGPPMVMVESNWTSFCATRKPALVSPDGSDIDAVIVWAPLARMRLAIALSSEGSLEEQALIDNRPQTNPACPNRNAMRLSSAKARPKCQLAAGYVNAN